MTDNLIVSLTDSVQEITFNRPDKKNALNLAMYDAMASAIDAAAANSEVKVLLLTGAGGCFTGGNDLMDFASVMTEPQTLLDGDNAIMKFLMALEQFPKPVVAAVQGAAVGVGTTLLLHCDLVYADESAQFSLPFVNLGLRPEYASSYLLPRLAGHVRAAEWLLLGEPFGADEAQAAGLINRKVDNVAAYARQRCRQLVSLAPRAVVETKALMKAANRECVASTMTAEVKAFASALASPEFAEAVAAFFEKRPADFSKL